MTTRIETLRALQARIRESMGADRELDVDIECALLGGEPYRPFPLAFGSDWRRKVGERYDDANRLTASLDACVALMAAVLPGYTRAVDATAPEYGIDVELFAPGMGSSVGHKETHDLEMHATLLAIFSAAIAELEAREKAA